MMSKVTRASGVAKATVIDYHYVSRTLVRSSCKKKVIIKYLTLIEVLVNNDGCHIPILVRVDLVRSLGVPLSRPDPQGLADGHVVGSSEDHARVDQGAPSHVHVQLLTLGIIVVHGLDPGIDIVHASCKFNRKI